jgi:hypothetical protein
MAELFRESNRRYQAAVCWLKSRLCSRLLLRRTLRPQDKAVRRLSYSTN